MVASAAAKLAAADAAKVATQVSIHAVDIGQKASAVANFRRQQPIVQSYQEDNKREQQWHQSHVNASYASVVANDVSHDDDVSPKTGSSITSVIAPQTSLLTDKDDSATVQSSQPLNQTIPFKEIKEPPSLNNLEAAETQILPVRPVYSTPPQIEQLTLLKEGLPIPATRLGRAFGFAQLGAGLAAGTLVEGVSRLFSGYNTNTGSLVVNDANSDRLVATLCRMRGAALKMGQMLSIQDESLLPPALSRALQQVRQGADAMPHRQLLEQLHSQLGDNWRDDFETFQERPFAAASIGQVHGAHLRDSHQPVAVKVQYPGVARSIQSDLGNLAMLVTRTGLAPKGLFIENVIRVGQQELLMECNYRREMANQQRMKQLVESDATLTKNRFVVPGVIESLTTDQIITSEFARGGTIDKVAHLSQDERNRIGRTIMYLTMQELFVWRFMQTDPNWGNFLYDVGSQTTTLIDFGATREYSKDFVDGYLRVVWASANRDEQALMDQSRRMKFLTGDENEEMVRAHKLSGYTVGEPFWENAPFDFAGSNISTRMGEHTSVFLRYRKTPPPEEVYTLHRKLAGAYMLCIKLGATIQCRDMLEDIVRNHTFADGLPPPEI
jgi:aarF domain-containing kinase